MYKLEQKFLTKYAKIPVHYGLNGGKGINPGETAILFGSEVSKDLYMEIYRAIITAGGNVIPAYRPNEFDRYGQNRFLAEQGNDAQISFFPEAYWQGVTDSIDHLIFINSDYDLHGYEGVDSKKISKMDAAIGPFIKKMRTEKEAQGKLSWTICLYGTQSMADEVGMSIEDYWEQIIDACYLRDDDPVATWRRIQDDINLIKGKLNALDIEILNIKGEGINLEIALGEHRKWLGASGHNIPSYEVFTSPDWRGTNGYVSFDQPLYYAGKRVSGISLEFIDGLITKASATENEDALHALIAETNLNKIGEFSLTDKRYSKINKFMASGLYDENIGGQFGNMHIALGKAYQEAYTGDLKKFTEKDKELLGFNVAGQHFDIINTRQKVVYAKSYNQTLFNKIYENGQYTI